MCCMCDVTTKGTWKGTDSWYTGSAIFIYCIDTSFKLIVTKCTEEAMTAGHQGNTTFLRPRWRDGGRTKDNYYVHV